MKILIPFLFLFTHGNAAVLSVECDGNKLVEGKISEVKVTVSAYSTMDDAYVYMTVKNETNPYRIRASSSAAALQLASMLNADDSDRLHVDIGKITRGNLETHCGTWNYTVKFR
jgi:hypothetical protein